MILNGGIDLSVGSTLGFSAVIAGFLLQGVPIEIFGVTLFPSVPVVVVCSPVPSGALVGLVNGILVSKFNVAPFVATLGMLYVVRGLALLMTNGLTINNLSGDAELGNTGFDWLGFNRILNIPIGVIIMGIVAIVLGFVLGRTRFGRWLYASGGNERAAELSGVPVKSVKVWVYVISGVCAAIAGLILASTLTSASPTAGNTYELTAIAAVVIGGAALTGGRGNVRGTLLGAFVIGFLSDGLVDRRGLRVLADGLHRRGHRGRRAPQHACSTAAAGAPLPRQPLRRRPPAGSATPPPSDQGRHGCGRHQLPDRDIGIEDRCRIHQERTASHDAQEGNGRHSPQPARSMPRPDGLFRRKRRHRLDRHQTPAAAERPAASSRSSSTTPRTRTGRPRATSPRPSRRSWATTTTVGAHKGDTNTENTLIDTAISNKSVGDHPRPGERGRLDRGGEEGDAARHPGLPRQRRDQRVGRWPRRSSCRTTRRARPSARQEWVKPHG